MIYKRPMFLGGSNKQQRYKEFLEENFPKKTFGAFFGLVVGIK